VIKIIDKNMSFECDSLMRHRNRTKEFEEKLKKIKDGDFRHSLDSPEFRKKPMVFSAQMEGEYIPSLKQKVLPPPFPLIAKKRNFVKEICSNLSKNEILEVNLGKK
jgi:hypothetical protein